MSQGIINYMATLFGSNGSGGKILPIGSTLAEQLTDADDVAGKLTFSDEVAAIEIFNTDGANPGVFTVNGVAIKVPASSTFKAVVGGTPSAEVTITGATSYIVNRYI